MFSGLLFCADCGSKLSRHVVADLPDGKKGVDNYVCSAYRKRKDGCTAHYIRTVVLEKLITDDLRHVTQYAAAHEKEFVNLLVDNSVKEHRRKTSEIQRTLETNQMRIAELDNIIKCLYEDNINRKISDERFIKLSGDYETEQKELTTSTRRLTDWLAKEKDKAINADRFLAIVRKHLAFEELTPTLLNTFVSKIIIHAPDKSSGKRVQKIEIVYNFVGKVEIPESPVQGTAELKVYDGKAKDEEKSE